MHWRIAFNFCGRKRKPPKKSAINAQRELTTGLEIKVAKRTQELQEANHTKDKFFSIISHDLRGPMGSLSIILNEIVKEGEAVESELLKGIRDASRNTYKLLEDLLQWSRSQSGQLKVMPEHFRLKQAVDETVAILSNQAAQKEVRLLIEGEETELMAYGDPGMINSVIRNLISNAIKFSLPGHTIRTRISQEDSYLKVEVIDEGTGMSQEKLDKLFKIGERSVSSPGTNNERGTGLGLGLL